MALLYHKAEGDMKMRDRLKAIVLAAGKGTRLRTEGCDLPKVMRLAAGRPLLSYVLDGLSFIDNEDITIVVGYKKEDVMAGFPQYSFAEQREQLGTGHAVMSAASVLDGYDGAVLVCCGDMPLLKRETYKAMWDAYRTSNTACVILTGTADTYLPYGRIVRDENGEFVKMVEEKDCTEEQKKITELNSGVYIFDSALLLSALKELKSDNAQGEYYLTDVPAILKSRGEKISLCRRELGNEIIGVNTVEQLKEVESIINADRTL